MSFVLSVVCVEASGEPETSHPPLILQEAIQDESAGKHSGYLVGLSRYFGMPVQGKVFYVWASAGGQARSGLPLYSGKEFFPWPENDADDSKPILLTIGLAHRAAFDSFLSHLLGVSKSGRIVVVCEWNGEVTRVQNKQEALADLDSGTVQMNGPWTRENFWQAHDSALIQCPSITVVESSAQEVCR